jgi:REP element-mobilizing transposase RayT
MQRAAEPVHVTLRARISPLRSQFVFPTVRLALLRAARRSPERFRILQFSVQSDHIHLLVEAHDKRALSSGMRGVAIRIARYVNDLLGRRGPLWADRWHGRALRTPREVRNALVYVLANFRKHAVAPRAQRAHRGSRVRSGGVNRALAFDPYSSAPWFDGWRDHSGAPRPSRHARAETDASPVNPPMTWLATVGWRRHGLIAINETPRLVSPLPRKKTP